MRARTAPAGVRRDARNRRRQTDRLRTQRAPGRYGRSGAGDRHSGAAADGPEQQLACHHADDQAGTTVKPGDPLVEFDRQEQLRNALDRRAELVDFEQQIKKRKAEEVAARATDDSTLKQAESTLEKARLELVKNEMLPKIQAEKNTPGA